MVSIPIPFLKRQKELVSANKLLPITAIEVIDGIPFLFLRNKAVSLFVKYTPPSHDTFTGPGMHSFFRDLDLSMFRLPEAEKVMFSFSLLVRPLRELYRNGHPNFQKAEQFVKGTKILSEYRKIHRENIIVRKRCNIVLERTFSFDYIFTITTIGRTKRDLQRLLRLFRTFKNFLESHNGRVELVKNPADVLRLIYEQINPLHFWQGFKKSKTLHEQMFVSDAKEYEPGIIKYDGHYWTVLKVENIAGFKSEESEESSSSSDEKIGTGFFINSDLLPKILLKEVHFPFRYVANLYVPDQESERNRLSDAKGLAYSVSVFISSEREQNLAKARHIEAFLKDAASLGFRFIRYSGNIVLWGKTIEELENKITLMRAAFRKEEVELFQDILSPVETIFISSVSGLSAAHPEKQVIISSEMAGALCPVMGPFYGTEDSPVLVAENRNNSPVGVSLTSRDAAKWGTIVIAPSGSGKTFFMNTLISHALSLKDPPVVCIMDMSSRPSYKGLHFSYGGLYITMDMSGRAPINPFEFKFPRKWPPVRHKGFLLDSFFPSLIGDKEGKIPPGWQSALTEAIDRVYTLRLNREEDPRRIDDTELLDMEELVPFKTFLEAKEHFLKEGQYALAELCHRWSMPTLSDLFHVLGTDMRIRQSVGEEVVKELQDHIAIYLNEPYNNIFDKPTGGRGKLLVGEAETLFIIIEMAEILNFPSILPTVFLMLRNYILETFSLYEEDKPDVERYPELAKLFFKVSVRPKLMFYDEWHNIKDYPIPQRIVSYDYRQGRTLKRIPVIISQSATDVSEDILVNTANKILLSHTPPGQTDETALSAAKKAFQFDDRLFEVLKSVRLVKGEYSEALFVSEGIGTGVVRLRPTPEEIWNQTSDAVSLSVKEEILKRLESMGYDARALYDKVVEVLARLYPDEKLDRPETEVVELVVNEVVKLKKVA